MGFVGFQLAMGVTPIAGWSRMDDWFIRETTIKMDDDWGYPLFQETTIYNYPGKLT